MPHFLQSLPWRRFNESQGKETFELRGEGWSVLSMAETSRGVSRLYAPYGPTADSAESLTMALKALEELALKQAAVFLRVEPTGFLGGNDAARAVLQKLGFRLVKQIQPADTLVIDLTLDEGDLLKQIGATNRNLYRGIERRGLEISQSTDVADIHHLSEILEKIARGKDDFAPREAAYLEAQALSLFEQGNARLFLVRHDGKVVAASLVYESDGVRYYAHSGADPEKRKLRAGNVLVSYMLFEAKSRGMTEFDLYGIAPTDDPKHPWAGFTQFKKSFGGAVRHYVGTWEKPMKRARYVIYQKARQLAENRF